MIKCLLVILIVAGASLPAGGYRVYPSQGSDYVKLEVKGKLLHQGAAYFIETHDSHFSNTRLLVTLERSEDKNRSLDQHLNALDGKSVLARGFLDCRRIGQEPSRSTST